MLDKLDNIQIPDHPAETKAERLQQIAEQVTQKLPLPLKILMGNMLPSFHQVLESESPEVIDENIGIGMERLREVVDFVQYGDHSRE
ncbi:hypothetical protein CN684_31190 [Bacillus wiedmannii]|uniref:Uncharacterized protein n=1 Tax=Bacillus wiedmannii TaxID=1890302 RepID=A0A2A7VQD6_9BACI|nr:hypothetical protein CN684_31190 [Bacillus wiedmannii]